MLEVRLMRETDEMNTKTEESDHQPTELDADMAESANAAASNVEALLENMAVLARERDEAKDAALRAMADFQNFRRRAQQEKEQLRQTATENLVAELIPVLDNFERTIAALEQGASVDAVLNGVKSIDKQMRSVLEGVRLQRIEALGQPFDPILHEAIGTDDSDELPENVVTAELEPGYKLADQIIRPARVKVSKKP
jgi:molecular chaperone GrpE